MGMSNNIKKIKVAIYIDSFDVYEWQHLIFEKIAELEHIKINLVMVDKVKKNIFTSVRNLIVICGYWYIKLEEKVFKVKKSAFKKKSIRKLITERNLNFFETNSSESSDKSLDAIKNHAIDVIIVLARKKLSDCFVEIAKYGVWYQYYDSILNKNEATYLIGDIFENAVANDAAEDVHVINTYMLYESYSKKDKISLIRGRNATLWKSASFIPRRLESLVRCKHELFVKKIQHSDYIRSSIKGIINAICQLYSHICRVTKTKILNKFFIKQWILLYTFDKKEPVAKFKHLVPDKDRFWADPFIVYHNTKYYIFFEELIKREKFGNISLIELDQDGVLSKPQQIIKKPYHLSYPFVFEWENNFFMIPETYQNNTIEIYRCHDFPLEWKFEKNLMENIRAVDTTLIEHNGKWWLFANVDEQDNIQTTDELHLYYSDNPLADIWTPRPNNPIVTHAGRSRLGGKLFFENNKLYRPSQDSSFYYGYAIHINQVTILNKEHYEETLVQTVKPGKFSQMKCLHTINHANDMLIIDGKTQGFRY